MVPLSISLISVCTTFLIFRNRKETWHIAIIKVTNENKFRTHYYQGILKMYIPLTYYC